jgi:hypothetical protein
LKNFSSKQSVVIPSSIVFRCWRSNGLSVLVSPSKRLIVISTTHWVTAQGANSASYT